jgi:LuxR family maltose regulon positive regulatory protein
LLDNDPEHRLTLICAPAGYGKSTLTAQWLAKAAVPSTWLSLEASDNKPQTFFSLIVAALQAIDRSLATTTEALLSRQGRFHVDAIINQLIGEISVTTRPFILVLDDYHIIEEPEIHRAMDLMLQHMPLSMRLVLISRTEPPLQLARLRASGEICELRREHLAFTEGEALHFYQDSLGLDLTPGEVGTVYERTEGWVAGLYLAGHAMRGQPRERVRQYVEEFAGNVLFGNQYLWEEVIQNQSDDVQAFLLRTSILDRFTPSLCDEVMEAQDSENMILRCGQENLFVLPLDEQGVWHRYHHLFAEILRDRLARSVSDAEVYALHQRAAAWLERNDLLDDAIRHAIAGHAWDQALRLLENLCASLFERDDVATLRVWLEGLPPDILNRSSRLAFWLSWSLGRTGRWTEATEVLRSTEKAWTASGDQPSQGLLLLWYAGRALFAFDNRKAMEYADQALDLLPDDLPTERVFALMAKGIAHMNCGEPTETEHSFADVRTIIDSKHLDVLQPFEMAFSAMMLNQQGRLQESTVLSRRVIQNAGEMPTEISAQVALLQLGQVQYEQGALDEARRCFLKADALAEMTRALQLRARIRSGLARIAWAQGEIEEALDEVDQAIDCARQLGTLTEIRSARAQQARFWIASRQLGLARRWVDSCELDPYLPAEYERQEEHLTYVRLLIKERQPDLALNTLKSLQTQAEAAGRQGDLVEILLLSALAYKVQEIPNDALQSLYGALELGERYGYVRIFVDEGEELASLLRHAAARGRHRDYAQRLLDEIQGTALTEALRQSDANSLLSEREAEVLRLVAAGLPNRDIGQRLYISEKTVKTHMGSILGKLRVTNRTQAVDQARHLGLL